MKPLDIEKDITTKMEHAGEQVPVSMAAWNQTIYNNLVFKLMYDSRKDWGSQDESAPNELSLVKDGKEEKSKREGLLESLIFHIRDHQQSGNVELTEMIHLALSCALGKKPNRSNISGLHEGLVKALLKDFGITEDFITG